MPLTGRLVADFASFYDAVRKAEVSLTSFESGAGKVGKALDRMANSFSGKKVIQDATLMVQAVEKIGGVSQLTRDELTRLQNTVGAATEKMKAIGATVPESFKQITIEAARAQITFTDVATAIGAVGAAVGGLAAGLGVLGARGADVADVREQFNTLTASIGQSADAILEKLRPATLGTMSDFELMQTVNQGLSQGLVLTADQLEQTADTAAVLADRIGGDTAQAFETLINAMATGKDKQLAAIGLNIDAAAAQDAYAASIGKTAKDLTEQEKKQASTNAILAEGERVLRQSGKAQADFGDAIAASQTKLKNFLDDVGVWVATTPSIQGWATGITTASSAITALALAAGPVWALFKNTAVFTSLSTVFTALGISAAGVTAVLWPLAIAIGAVMAAWQIGKMESVKNYVAEWALASDNLTAVIFRAIAGIDQMSEAEAKAAVNATANAEAQAKAAAATNERMAAADKNALIFLQAEAERQAADAAAKTAEATAKAAAEVEKRRKAIEGLGLVSIRSVNEALRELAGAQAQAAKDGLDHDRVLAATLPKLKELMDKAKASGTVTRELARQYQEAGEAWRRTADFSFDQLKGTEDIAAATAHLRDEAARLNPVLRATAEQAGDLGVIFAEQSKQLQQDHPLISPEVWTKGRALDAMKRAGIESQKVLDDLAKQARDDYEAIAAYAGVNSREAAEAFKRAIEAQKRASHELPTLWQGTIAPAIKDAVDDIGRKVSSTFGDMLTGAQGFKDGFVSIWQSIKQSISDILSDILNEFTNRFIKGLIASMTGAQGGFAGAFAGMFGGGGGGGGLIGNAAGGWLAGLFGGGGSAAALGAMPSAATQAANMAALGWTLGGTGATTAATGTAAAGTAGAAGSGFGATIGALATNPITWAAAGAALLGWGIASKGWFRGGEEGVKVNPARDQWFQQFVDRYKGQYSPYESLVRALEESGVVGDKASNIIRDIYAADTMSEYEAAVAKATEALESQAAVNATTPREQTVNIAPGAIVVNGADRDPVELAREIADALVRVIVRENPGGSGTMLKNYVTT